MARPASSRAPELELRRRRGGGLSFESLEPRSLLSAAPFTSVPDLIAADDAGASATDNKTNVTTPTFTGTARNAESVRIFVGRTDAGTVPVSGGRWSFTHPGLVDGRHAVSAQAVAANGRLGARTKPLSVEVRTRPPAAPTLGIVRVGAAPTTAATAATNEARPTFGGRGPANGTVEVFVDGVPTGRATVVRNGFTVRAAAPLASGQRTVTAVAADLFGNRSGAVTLALAVDATAPVVESIVRTSLTSVAVTFSESVRNISLANFRFSGRTSDGMRISPLSLTDRRLTAVVGPISGVLSADGRTYTIRAPNLDFDAGDYVLTLPAAGSVTDLAGNRLARDASLAIKVAGA